MEIQRDEHKRKGAFYVEQDGEWVAELTYERSDDGTMVIDHTEVDEELREQNVGRDLVVAAVEFARENGMKIRPDCPFARDVIESTPELKDVLA